MSAAGYSRSKAVGVVVACAPALGGGEDLATRNPPPTSQRVRSYCATKTGLRTAREGIQRQAGESGSPRPSRALLAVDRNSFHLLLRSR